MTALLRAAFSAGAAYFGMLVLYPDWSGDGYHYLAIAIAAGGAFGAFLLHRMIDAMGFAAKLAVDVLLAAGICLFLGLTMPQKSGKPPFFQWLEGQRPDAKTIKRGLERLRESVR